MFSKYYSFAFSWLLLGALVATPVFARTTLAAQAKQQAQEAKHKKHVVEWGTNKRVTIKLKSGDKLDGRIAEIKDNSFTIQLIDKSQVASREINYSDIEKLSGKGDHEGAKIAGYIVIGALAALGTIVLIGLTLAD